MPKRPYAKQIKSHIFVRRGTSVYERLLRIRGILERRAGCAYSWAQVLEILLKKVRF